MSELPKTTDLIYRDAAIEAVFDRILQIGYENNVDVLSIRQAIREVPAAGYELTKAEAYAIAEFIDCNIFEAIRNDSDWDSFQALRNLVHAYEKCCAMSGFIGLTDKREEGQEEEDDESSR